MFVNIVKRVAVVVIWLHTHPNTITEPWMRVVAIIANLVQIAIVLSVFLIQGISFVSLTIPALFALLIIAVFNLSVLLFTGSPISGSILNEKKAVIKRRDFRVGYRPGRHSKLGIGNQRYDLLDIAEGGARVSIGRGERLKKHLRCRIQLLCGEMLSTKAVVIRREGDKVALAFKSAVEYRTLQKERQVVAGLQQ
jgi:hypothetical protein